FGTVQIVIESSDPILRESAGLLLIEKLQTLPKELVTQLSVDDGPLHRYVWQHRFLFPDLKDLTDARDALKNRIERAKLAANPLFISLDDEPEQGDRLGDLEKKLDDLEAKANLPPLRVSADKRMQLIVLQTSFPPSDPKHANQLIDTIQDMMKEVRLEVGDTVKFGLTGNIT